MSSNAPTTIDQVVERMHAIEQALPHSDGVMWFNRLYLSVTEAVKQAVDAHEFAASAFLSRLDVVFAGLYFAAYDASQAPGGTIPKAWSPLFDSRAREDVAPIQFALCGMNAHINNDLPQALVATAHELGFKLSRDSQQHQDYLAVNKTLQATEDRVKHWFDTGFVGDVDRAFGHVDDAIAMWDVARARDQAWTTAETLQEIAGVPILKKEFLDGLGHMVGFAGRGLVIADAL